MIKVDDMTLLTSDADWNDWCRERQDEWRSHFRIEGTDVPPTRYPVLIASEFVSDVGNSYRDELRIHLCYMDTLAVKDAEWQEARKQA